MGYHFDENNFQNIDKNSKPAKTQISVEKYFYDLFRTNLEYFKDLIDTPNRQVWNVYYIEKNSHI